MEPPTPAHPCLFIPMSDRNSLRPCRDGFADLTVTERAAHAEILHRAYSIWESNGRPVGHALADWLQAEAEVQNER